MYKNSNTPAKPKPDKEKNVAVSSFTGPASSDACRQQFPALINKDIKHVFLENAGGSQVPLCVPNAIRDYMCNSFVQLGAGYSLADKADAVIEQAHTFGEMFVNGQGTGRTVIGSSTTQLMTNLALSYQDMMGAGDNVVIVQTAHEANAGPWANLAKAGIEVRTWECDPESYVCPLEQLDKLIDERTKVLACVHVSNLIGDIVDIKSICEIAHRKGCKVVVDGVAFAGHRVVDVEELGCDYYVFSAYKVYGPHGMSLLWGRNEAFAEVGLKGRNHWFVPDDDYPYKHELGGINHEQCAGWNAVADYLAFVAGHKGEFTRATIVAAFERMKDLEEPLTERLANFLLKDPRYTLLGHGPEGGSGKGRVPTFAFLHKTLSPPVVVDALQAAGIGCRSGHMYARRLMDGLKIDPTYGVVRVSALHYNTIEEIERVIAVLKALPPQNAQL